VADMVTQARWPRGLASPRRSARAAARVAVLAGLACATLLAAGAQAPTLSIRHDARALKPGEVVRLTVTASVPLGSLHGTAFGHDVGFFHGRRDGSWEALVGIDVDMAPGRYEVAVEARGAMGAVQARATHVLLVTRQVFPTRRLSVPEQFVNPPAGEQPRIEREAKAVAAVVARVSPEALWTAPFERPVAGDATSRFGGRSIINGQRRSLHAGVDFRAATGTAVRAPARGRVVLAADQYFPGQVVILDHGLGLFSFLAHLSRIIVSEGQMVEGGEVVGLSGASGRVTGPHLHWSVRLNGARVDPLSLVAVLQGPPR